MKHRILIASMPLIFALSLTAIFILIRWPLWEESLMSDNSPVAWLSSAQLLALSLLAFRLGLDGTLGRGLSLWLGASMAYMALDEQLMLHEYWKYGCGEWLQLCRYGWVRELPMLSIAVLGVPTVALLARAIPDRLFRTFLFASLGCGAFAIFVDLSDISIALSRLEETFEVVAEALFVGALLMASPAGARRIP